MSAAYTGPCIADWGPKSIRVFTAEAVPRLIATIRALDAGDVDQLLRAYGWKRVGAWMRKDDMPADHKLAAIERLGDTWPDTQPGVKAVDPDVEQLERDQAHGRERREAMH